MSPADASAVSSDASLARSLSDDSWQAHVTREAAKAIGDALIEAELLDHRVERLRTDHLEVLANAAISRYVQLSSERMAAGKELEGKQKEVGWY